MKLIDGINANKAKIGVKKFIRKWYDCCYNWLL